MAEGTRRDARPVSRPLLPTRAPSPPRLQVGFLKALRSEYVVEVVDYYEDPHGKQHCVVLEYGEQSLADYARYRQQPFNRHRSTGAAVETTTVESDRANALCARSPLRLLALAPNCFCVD